MKVGDHVTKPTGYPFPGFVVGLFRNRAGDLRCVVEADLSPGLLHIFNPDQLHITRDN